MSSFLIDNYSEKTVQQLAEAAYRAKDSFDSEQVIDLLFDLQGELIKGEYTELFDEAGKAGITHKFFVMKTFFRTLSEIEMIKK